jgi:tRNA pseudouridine55 synthase
MIDGVLRVDKLAGPTSHDVVDRVRRVLGQKAVGHAGTLDPLGTGLLLVLAGRATKISNLLADLDKVYRVRVRLGTATDSGDLEGAVIEERPVPADLAARLPAALARFTGELRQVPPMASALKVGGEPLHRLRRAGRTVERAARPIVVHEISCLDLTPPELELRIRCGKGTYVRTLAADLAGDLGTCGHLTALRRERIGAFDLAGAITSDELRALDRETVLARAGMSLGEALAHLPAVEISAVAVSGVREGRLPAPADLARLTRPLVPGDLARLEAPGGEVVAIVEAAAAIASLPVESPEARPFRFWRVLTPAHSFSGARARG